MARRLPPLNALRAFEAAGRHLSFTRAAEELSVTQAAISHQVKSLEEFLGVQLFIRLNRALKLTEAGRGFLPTITESLDQIDSATRGLERRDSGGGLTVSVLPSFAAKWLLPRLGRFRAEQPDVDVLVSANDRLVDFDREDTDVAIRYGRGDYPGLQVDYLMGDGVFPICSPRLLTGRYPLLSPEDLRHHVLLHDDVARTDDGPDWRIWLKAAGYADFDSERGPGYSDSSMVIQAAIDGQGVALGRWSLAADDLIAGRLVEPFGPRLSTRSAYYFLAPPRTTNWPKVQAFRAWLTEEAASSAAAGEPPPRPPLDGRYAPRLT